MARTEKKTTAVPTPVNRVAAPSIHSTTPKTRVVVKQGLVEVGDLLVHPRHAARMRRRLRLGITGVPASVRAKKQAELMAKLYPNEPGAVSSPASTVKAPTVAPANA